MLNNSLKELSYQIDHINKFIQVYINEKKIKGRVNNQESFLKVLFPYYIPQLNLPQTPSRLFKSHDLQLQHLWHGL